MKKVKDRVKVAKEHLEEIDREAAKDNPDREKMWDFFEVLWQEMGELEMDIADKDRFCYLCGYGRENARPWPGPPRRRPGRLPRYLGPEVPDGD